MVKELENCPFCGGKIAIIKGFPHFPFLFFKCRNPKCKAIVSFDNEECNGNPKMALKYWNERNCHDKS